MNSDFYRVVLPMAVFLSLASCNEEDFRDVSGGDAEMTFTAQMPSTGLDSRSFGDGKTATTLTYAIYETGETEKLIKTDDTVKFTGLSASFSMHLTKGKSYQLVFWADNREAGHYAFNSATKEITVVDYATAVANDESRDAFFGSLSFTVDGADTKAIQLKRPFAQVNFGTNDFADAQIDPTDHTLLTSVTVGSYATLNLATGTVSSPVTVTYLQAEAPQAPEVYPVDDYVYLGMNYVLCNPEKAICDINLNVEYQGKEILSHEYTNIPIQRNYRTNIHGSLLTDATNFIVTIAPAFDNEEGGEPVVTPKGTEPATLVIDGITRYQVTNSDELLWLGTNTIDWTDRAIDIVNDIDMNGQELTPIDIDNTGDTPVEVDGKGNTVSNYSLASEVDNVGLFGIAHNVTIENLNVRDVTFRGTGTENVGAVVGSLTGSMSNIEASNVNLDADGNVGAVAGSISGISDFEFDQTLSNVQVFDSEIAGRAAAGAIAGEFDNSGRGRAADAPFIVGEAVVANNTITSLTPGRTGLLAGCATNLSAAIEYEAVYNTSNNISNFMGGNARAEVITVAAGLEWKDGVCTVSSYSQLVRAFSAVSSTNKEIRLSRDINLRGCMVHSITVSDECEVTFDGCNHIVSDFKLGDAGSNPAFFKKNKQDELISPASRFNVRNVTFKDVALNGDYKSVIINVIMGVFSNVTVDNCSLHTDNNKANYAGLMCGLNHAGSLQNCKVINSSVTYGRCAGLISGVVCDSSVKYENCSLSYSQVTAEDQYGPYTGYTYYGKYLTVKSCTLENVTPTEIYCTLDKSKYADVRFQN